MNIFCFFVTSKFIHDDKTANLLRGDLKIRVLHEKAVYQNELVNVLYEQNYFGFKESAYDYVDPH